MEKMDYEHRSTKEKYFRFLKAWKESGFLRRFKWSPDGGRIFDTKDLRNNLNDRLDDTARLRGELRYREKMMKLKIKGKKGQVVEVKASDFDKPSDIEILNDDIVHLT